LFTTNNNITLTHYIQQLHFNRKMKIYACNMNKHITKTLIKKYTFLLLPTTFFCNLIIFLWASSNYCSNCWYVLWNVSWLRSATTTCLPSTFAPLTLTRPLVLWKKLQELGLYIHQQIRIMKNIKRGHGEHKNASSIALTPNFDISKNAFWRCWCSLKSATTWVICTGTR